MNDLLQSLHQSQSKSWPLLWSWLTICLLVVAYPGPYVLYGVDAGCYARIAIDLLGKPLTQWGQLAVDGQPFFEHPPLAIWLEAVWLLWLGPQPEQLIWLARSYMLVLTALIGLLARAWADVRVATMAMLSLACLPGFYFEAQNPMLELPLTVAMAAAMLAGTATCNWVAFVGFASCSMAAWLIKGPPAGLLLLYVLGLGVLGQRQRAYLLLQASLVAIIGVGVVFWALGPAYCEGYWYRQIVASLLKQRDQHAIRNSVLFYPKALWRWYSPGVLCLPVALWYGRQSQLKPAYRQCLLMAAGMLIGLLVFFMLIPKQNSWYIHPCMVFMALLMGCCWQGWLTWEQQQRVVLGALAISLLYLLVAISYPHLWHRGRQGLIAIHSQPSPPFRADQVREIANCSTFSGWRADHLLALKWQVKAVPCDGDAPYVLYDTGWQVKASDLD